MMFFELSIDYGLFIDLTAEDDYILKLMLWLGITKRGIIDSVLIYVWVQDFVSILSQSLSNEWS